LFLVSGASLYCGAAIAVLLFPQSTPGAVTWMRQAGSAIVLLAWRRPDLRKTSWRQLVTASVFGLVTAGMNWAFYEAIARIPMGTAVAIEFAGPALVAAFGSRTKRDFGALALVLCGVWLITDAQVSGSPLGVALAGSAALLWAAYIVVGNKVAKAGTGIDDLAIGAGVATILCSPLAISISHNAGRISMGLGAFIALGLAIGVLSSVVPYGLDQVVLRSVGASTFALMLALLPVMATVMGVVILHQIPTWTELIGVLIVVVGVGVRRRR
jgi:inner membrane transporter RhtA